MNIQKTLRPARGILRARADVNPATVVAELQAAFAAFKAENDTALKAKADVVVTEKVERINAQVGELQAQLDVANLKLAAFAEAGPASQRKPKPSNPEATKVFEGYMRGHFEVHADLRKSPDTDGGFLAPIEWDRTITDRLKLVSPIRQLATVISTQKAGFSKVTNDRATSSGWVSETGARPATPNSAFGAVAFPIGEIYSNVPASQGILDDAEVDLETWLAGEVETEFAQEEGLAFVSGSGADNRPFGFLNYCTGGAQAARHPFGAILLRNSGAAAAITADGLIDLVHDLPTRFTPNATFVMNRLTLAAVRKLKDTTNNYLWQPSYASGQPQTISGYPVAEVPDMPNIAASARPIVFGDFKLGYLVIDRFGTRMLRDPYTNKPNVMFYVTKRVGGGVQNPEAFRALNISV